MAFVVGITSIGTQDSQVVGQTAYLCADNARHCSGIVASANGLEEPVIQLKCIR
jgi:hypothetical protein